MPHCEDMCTRRAHGFKSGEGLHLCLTGDMTVKLLDGTYKTMKELSDSGEDVWVYSIDTTTGEIVPGLAEKPHLTGYRSDIVKITFDNGKTIKCTSNHKILMRDCTYKEAKDLIYGDSCMPIYYNCEKDGEKIYESIQNTRRGKGTIKWDKKWKCNTKSIATHHMVYRHTNNFHEKLGKNINNVHHKDKNIWNNTPENLILLSKSEHMSKHPFSKESCIKGGINGSISFKDKLQNNEEFKNNFCNLCSVNTKIQWENEEFRNKMESICRENFRTGREKSNKNPKAIFNRGKSKVVKGISLLQFKCQQNNEELNIYNYDEMQKKYKTSSRLGENGCHIPLIKTILKYFNSLEEALNESKVYNHKVIKIEFLPEDNVPVYDLSVPHFENFAVDLGDNSCVVVSNCRAAHAEQNILTQLARNNAGSSKDAIMYITHSPCNECTKLIINSGIKKIVYCKEYPNPQAFDNLKTCGIEVIQMDKDAILNKMKSFIDLI